MYNKAGPLLLCKGNRGADKCEFFNAAGNAKRVVRGRVEHVEGK